MEEQPAPFPPASSSSSAIRGRRRVIVWAAIFFAVNSVILRAIIYRRPSPSATSPVYEREWSVAEKAVEVSVRDAEGPERFSIEFRPHPGKKYRFVHIMEMRKPGDTAKRADQRTLLTGEVAIERLADGRLGIEYKEKASRTAVTGSLWQADRLNTGFAVVENGKVVPAVRRGDRVEVVPQTTGRPAAFQGISTLVALEFPLGMELKVGTEWSTQSLFGTRMINKILGFSEIDGKKTVRVQAEPDSRDDLGTAKEMFKGAPAFIRAMTRNVWQRDRSIIYVDLETGLVVRREAETEYGVLPKADATERVPSNESHTIVQLTEI